VKALLNSGATGLFMSKRLAEREGFKLEKLERLLKVRNVNRSNNSGKAITHEAEANVYYKGHMEGVKLDVCELGKVDVILGMPWLVAHNLEINWETGEVKMIRYPSICRKYIEKKDIAKKEIVKRKKARRAEINDEKNLRWMIEEKERMEEMREDHRKVEEMVPKWFYQWLKVFRKVEYERIPTRKPWDHTIDLRLDFVPRKGRIYPLFCTEKEEV